MSQEILVVGLLLGLSVLPVQAAESQFTLATGVGYNFFTLTEINHHLQARNNYLNNDLIKGPASPLANLIPSWAITIFQPLRGGVSHWGRELFWFTPYLAGGGEIKQAALISVYKAADSLNTYYREKYKVKLTGMSGLIVYRPRWLNPSLKITYYSNYGKRLDFVAPGNYIYSTVPSDLKNDWNKMTNETGYMLSSGTSMAVPHVAGVAALIIAAKQASAPKQVRRQLKLTAQDLGSNGRDLKFGFGLINAHAAVVDARITEIKIFAGRRKGDTITKLTKVVHPTSAGTYCLPSPKTGDYFLYGWIDMTKDDKINKGDYFGRQRVAKAGTGIDFSLDLITNNINIYVVQEESP